MDKITIPNEILIPEVGRLLAEGREVEMRPKGNSMLPFIRQEKDNVVLKKKDNVEKGDIVLVDLGGRYVLHRIIAEDGERLTLMGDGNVRGTESCTKDKVLGTVVKIVRPGGKSVTPSKGKLWKALLPIRRYLLAFYRRVWTKI
ncbi:MAG: S24/S26 family peptidase [Bacteroidales bacterium]|nr:S24/S26 family peptidase [Bacteroidales bacterium]